jgi:hypothetical protein
MISKNRISNYYIIKREDKTVEARNILINKAHDLFFKVERQIIAIGKMTDVIEKTCDKVIDLDKKYK